MNSVIMELSGTAPRLSPPNVMSVNGDGYPTTADPKPFKTKIKVAGFVPQPTYFFDGPQKSTQKMALKPGPLEVANPPAMSRFPLCFTLAASRILRPTDLIVFHD
ncbi:MAG: hypothetical protein J7K75_05200 [Desulfuromonas sp.]|nr:hypothetical protein [Desulfuromonas sp.]